MDIEGSVIVVTGGASGLGLATARAAADRGATVLIADLNEQPAKVAADSLGESAHHVAADVADDEQVAEAFRLAQSLGPVRGVVHCAGRGGTVRVLDRGGVPGSLPDFEAIVRVNLVGTYNVLRHGAAAMAALDPVAEERGVFVLTSSVAAFEGQVGQIAYTASKAGIAGMTLTAARELASKLIRVCTIAPGVFDTPILARLSDEVKSSLGASIPHPSRLGRPPEFAQLALHVIENAMLNGETIRLDGAIRMAPR